MQHSYFSLPENEHSFRTNILCLCANNDSKLSKLNIKNTMKLKYAHFGCFNVAGLNYHPIYKQVIKELTIGTELKLLRELNNHYDSKAVAVFYKGYKIGYIPNLPDLATGP